MKVKIEKLDHFGRGITHINDKICFVKDALPEETVDIEIIDDNKKYSEAITKKVLEKSLNRIKSQCKYSNKCGGCTFSHLLFEEENKYKNLVERLDYNFQPGFIFNFQVRVQYIHLYRVYLNHPDMFYFLIVL